MIVRGIEMRLSKFVVAALFAACWATQAWAQTPTLAEPPATARAYVFRSATSEHGREWQWRAPDGTIWSRQETSLRGSTTSADQQLVLDAQGLPTRVIVRGTSSGRGDLGETFTRSNGRASWATQSDRGEATNAGFYLPLASSLATTEALTRALLAAPNNTLDVLPAGRARLERLTELTVRSAAGEQTITAYGIVGLSWSPQVVWLDANNELFATGSWISYVREGWQSSGAEIAAAQTAALAQRSAQLAARVGERLAAPLVFRNVRIFDSEAGVFRQGQTVVVENGRISAVGPSGGVRAPRGARVIRGAGRTLLPGLWDSHMHISDDVYGPLLLMNGITSVRDIGNDAAQFEDRRRRIAEGALLGPQIFASMLIDGPGDRAAQAAPLVTTAEEAIALTQRAHERGYIGIKLYGSLDPALVPIFGAETERLGMQLSGHVPRTMRPSQAIAGGYDELTHYYFTLMEGMPDSVVNESNGRMRFLGPAEFGRDIDYNDGPVARLLDDMARRGIRADPTIGLIDRMLLAQPGELQYPFRQYAGRLPAQVERGLRAGGAQLPPGVTREHAEASAANMLRLIAEMHRRGIVFVAGTDGTGGMELVGELEAYVRAGLTPAQALQTATIVPARVVRNDGETGSIAVGKMADLFLVEGNPERDLSVLRQVEWVVQRDRLFEAQQLREAVGIGRARRN